MGVSDPPPGGGSGDPPEGAKMGQKWPIFPTLVKPFKRRGFIFFDFMLLLLPQKSLIGPIFFWV